MQNVKWRYTLVWDQSIKPNLLLKTKFGLKQKPNLIWTIGLKPNRPNVVTI